MPVLKSLSFTAMPKNAGDAVHMRRAKFIEKLEEQKLLLADPGYVRTVQRTAEVDGVKQAVARMRWCNRGATEHSSKNSDNGLRRGQLSWDCTEIHLRALQTESEGLRKWCRL